jgi:hypothetical protein
MDQFIIQFCMIMASSTYNMSPAPCQAALNATYQQTGAKSGYDLLQNTYTKKGNDFIKDNINDDLVYATIGIYELNDIYKKQQIRVQTKCNVFLCDNLSIDLTTTAQSYNLGWKWNF